MRTPLHPCARHVEDHPVSQIVSRVRAQAFGLLYLLTIYFETFRDGWWIVFTSQDQELAYVRAHRLDRGNPWGTIPHPPRPPPARC